MSENVMQKSFHAGEWAPALNARVDLAKYRSAVALGLNFYVDYRGGLSTRMGTKYILQCFRSSTAVRLIGFQASFTTSYVLEFGDQYIRFYNNGAAVLETGIAITGVTQANPAVVSVANTWNVGDWVFISGVLGMTQLNGKYYQISARSAGTITLANLNGVDINSTAYGAYTSGGTAARVYTLPSPYAAADLALLKYTPNINTLVICHPSYQPYVLTFISAANWTLSVIPFGASIDAPTGVSVATTLGAGSVNYAYAVTSVDINGQESSPSTAAVLANKLDLRTTAGTNTISWTARSGAQYYNVYKAELSYAGAVPSGIAFGFIGFTTGISLIDSNIAPDFSETPPVAQNPFQGAGVASVAVTTAGTYTTTPTVIIGAAPSGGVTATAHVTMQVVGTPTVAALTDAGHTVGQAIHFPNGVVLIVATITLGRIDTFQPITFPGSNPGSLVGSTPANPVASTDFPAVTANFTWGVASVVIDSPGAGYTSAPAVTFSSGAAAATSTLLSASSGNPSIPIYFQQRLVLAGPRGSPQQFNMSIPGSYYNYNISRPIQPDDAIQGTLVSSQLNTIKSLVAMPSGLVMLSDRQAWLVNGGSAGSNVSPININAQAQAYNGSSDVPPIVANYDILYVQAKGSIVRDLTYNFYTNVYTGTDISVLSSHLFYGYTINGWAFAEEPFKVVWAIRDDGILLSLTFLKEQEIVGWCHSDTTGLFKSVTTVTEQVDFGSVDATYFVVQRVINGNTVKYVERMAERIFPNGVEDAWCVDAGLQYDGAPVTSFSGAEHLAGATVTGLADGLVITPFVMATNGNFTLPSAASKVTVGLAYTPQLQTLQLDTGEPTTQGKRKSISAVTIRCQETLGLSIGKDFDTLVPMKDLVVGNVGSMTNEVVTGLVTGDARTIVNPSWDPQGQYCIEQPYPFPATILGVIPEIAIGDK